MPFVQGKCENCGGILTVDPNLKAANCPFCGVAYVVQDTINNYNTTIHNVETLHADVVNVLDESSSEARIKAGFAYIKIGNYDLAEKEFANVTRVAPQNYLGWLGLIESLTVNYTKRIRSARELKKLKNYSKSVLTLAPIGKGNDLLKKFTYYVAAEEEHNDIEKEQLLGELTKKKDELKVLDDDNASKQHEINKYEDKIANLNKQNGGCGIAVLFLVGLVFFVVGLIIVFLVYTTDLEWTQEALTATIVFILSGVFCPVIWAFSNLEEKKRQKETNLIKTNQEEIEKEMKANDERIKTINLKIKSLQEKYALYE